MRPNILKKDNILRSYLFKEAFKCISQKIYTEIFVFLVAQKKQNAKIGIIISRKKVNLSVQRNLCKRLLKEFFRKKKKLFEHCYIVVIATKNAKNASKESIWESIEKFITQYQS